jgi:translation elongation factor EF-4
VGKRDNLQSDKIIKKSKTMNTSELRQQIDHNLERLSGENLKLVAEFLAYLADKESNEATQELLDIPDFIASFERGKKDVAEGRVKNWRTIRSDV